MLVKLPRGRNPEKSLLKAIRRGKKCSSTAFWIHRSKITWDPRGTPGFPCSYSISMQHPLIPQDQGCWPLPLTVGCASLTCSVVAGSGEGGCTVALGIILICAYYMGSETKLLYFSPNFKTQAGLQPKLSKNKTKPQKTPKKPKPQNPQTTPFSLSAFQLPYVQLPFQNQGRRS